ncbi:restriction endonuclease subunit S [Streptomyces sp. NPDC019990]|uniref:restriction endonuclease subunit S n=1 Tax=Streptomyces sp. NPDC019990 TaxID=3154693 RepID=UPI00340E5A2B
MSEGDKSTELPKGWAQATLGEIASWGSGGTPKSGESSFYDGEIPWAVIGDLNDGVVRSTARCITETGLKNSTAKIVPAGSLLLAMYGASIGKLGIAGVDMATNQAIAYARAGSAVDSKYLFYYLLGQRGDLVQKGKGAAQKNISQQIIKGWPVPLAPLEEQRRIVAALEEQFSRLDAAEGYAVKVRKKLQAYQASRELELVPSPNVDTAGHVLPEGWRMVQLSDISHSSGYGTSTKCGYDGGGSAVLRIPNIQSGTIDTADLKYALDVDLDLSAYKVQAGDMLVVRTNGSRDLIGRVAVSRENTECAFASYLIRFRINTKCASPDWISKVLSTRPWRRLIEAAAASTAGQYNLNLKKLGSLPIPLPPLEQQDSLTAVLDEIGASARLLTDAVDDASMKANALRRSLLTEAFAGRLVPQATDDEPAEALLDRIRTEQEAAEATKARRRSPRRAPALGKRSSETIRIPDARPPLPSVAPALAATQTALDLEIPS